MWLLAGLLARCCSRSCCSRKTRAPATVTIAATILGAAWIGLGLGHLLLLRDLLDHGGLAIFTVLLAVWAADTLAFFAGRSSAGTSSHR